MNKTPTTLIIMDGFGCRPENYGNAIDAAKHPNIDRLFAQIDKLTADDIQQVAKDVFAPEKLSVLIVR